MNRLLKKSLWSLLILFMLMNAVAFFHAYRFTHFNGDATAGVKKNESQLSLGEKLNALVFGVIIPSRKTLRCLLSRLKL